MVPLGESKKLKKLERKVDELETRIKYLEQRTNESRAYQVASWTLVLLEIAIAVISITEVLSG